MDIMGLLGVICVVAGVYFLITGAIILGLILVVVGIVLARGLVIR